MRKNPPDKTGEVYRFAPLDAYSRGERLMIRAAARAFYILINLVGKTTRFEIEGYEHYETLEREGVSPILAFWHNRIFLGTYFFRRSGFVVITSQSFDGEYIARFISLFGYGAVRGSSTRGGVKALVEMIRLMRGGAKMALTVDGPKGPLYEAKSGAVLLAKKTGCPILPFSVESAKFRQIKSWDRMQIPKLFSRAKVFFAAPIYVSKDADDEEMEKKRVEMQRQLDELVEFGKQWRNTLKN